MAGGALAGLIPTPDITNTLLRIKLFAQYALNKSSDLRFNLIHEKWSTDDWSWNLFPASGATPFSYGTTTDGTTVLSSPKQNSTFVGVRYIYKFQ
ncbi:MAG: MtrB/PioB family outer membrane beta-barrel protein [Burkholderiales bacterium]|nr:MtrB/PioB family outer membrane beta-barrel protein [Burkholderiales bacterium]